MCKDKMKKEDFKDFEQFGKEALDAIFVHLGLEGLNENVDYLLHIANNYNLVELVPFNKEKHGDVYDGDEGDYIWRKKEEAI